MKVYIAGAYTERELVSSYMRRLEAAGVTITLDWPRIVTAAANPDCDLTHAERQRYAMGDLKGVAEADVLWLMIPKGGSKGAWVELGYALGLMNGGAKLPRSVLASGDDKASIFTSVPEVYEVAAHEKAFDILVANHVLTRPRWRT